MELVPLIQRLQADASQFNTVYDQAIKRMQQFASETERLNRQIQRQNSLGSIKPPAVGTLGAVEQQLAMLGNLTKQGEAASKTIRDLREAIGRLRPETIDRMLGRDTGSKVAATAEQIRGLKGLMASISEPTGGGLFGKVGASPDQLRVVNQLLQQRRGLQDITRAATDAELRAVGGIVNAANSRRAAGLGIAEAARSEQTSTRDLIGLQIRQLGLQSQRAAQSRLFHQQELQGLMQTERRRNSFLSQMATSGPPGPGLLARLLGAPTPRTITPTGVISGGPRGPYGGTSPFAGMGGTLAGVGAGIGGMVMGMAQAATVGAAFALVVVGINAAGAALSTFAHVAAGSVVQIVSLGAELERTQVAFEVFTGSAAKGRDLLNQIMALALRTPYTTRQLSSISQMLLGAGVGQGNILPVLSRLGDIAGGDADRMRNLALAFSEVEAEGRLTGMRLRQFATAGLGIEDFAKTLGVGTAQFRAMMHEGSVSANVVTETINRVTSAGGRFFGMSARGMGTVSGQWSNLVEQLELFGAKIGVALFNRFDVVGILSKISSGLTAAAPRITDIVLQIFDRVYAAGQVFFDFMQTGWGALQKVLSGGSGSVADMIPSIEGVRQAFHSVLMVVIHIAETIAKLILASVQLTEVMIRLGRWVVPIPHTTEILRSIDEIKNLTKGMPEKVNSFFKDWDERFGKAGLLRPVVPPGGLPVASAGRSLAGALPGGIGAIVGGMVGAVAGPPTVGGAGRMGAAGPASGLGPAAATVGAGIGTFAGRSMIDTVRAGANDMIGPSADLIAGKLQVSAEAMKLAGDATKSFRAGTTPFEKFQRQFGLLEEAMRGPTIQLGPRGAFPPFPAELLGGGGGPALGREAGEFMMDQLFEDLQKGVKGPEEQLPKAETRFSKEAQDTINRSNVMTETTMDEVRRTLIESLKEHQEMKKALEEAVDALQEMARNGFVVG